MLKTSYEYMRLSAWLAGWLAASLQFPTSAFFFFYQSLSFLEHCSSLPAIGKLD